MAVATPMNQAGLEQIIQRADSELELFAEETDLLEKEIAARSAELDTIASRHSMRLQQLTIAEKTVAQLKADLATIQARSRLSENTLAAGDPEASAKDVTARLQKAEKEYERLRTRLSKESSTDDQREASAQKALNQAQDSLTALYTDQQSISAARAQAHEELGQVIQRTVQRRVDVLNEEIEVRRQGAARAVQALDIYKDEALHVLQRWPEIQDQVKPLLPYRDNSTDILEAQLQVINLLLSEGLGANIESGDVFRRAGLPWGDMPGLLAFDPANFYPAFNGSTSPTVLLERKRDIEKLLEVYRSEKKGITSPVVGSVQAKRHRW